MGVFKYFLIAITIFVNKSASEQPDIYFDDVSFMVGIFEINPMRPNQVSFVGQGVLVDSDKVITTSRIVYEYEFVFLLLLTFEKIYMGFYGVP